MNLNLSGNQHNENLFLLFKQTTLMGFFTSEVGATKVFQYASIPCDYLGCESLDNLGNKTWV